MFVGFKSYKVFLLGSKRSPYVLYVVWLRPELQPILRVGAAPRAVEEAWVEALPSGVAGLVAAVVLEDQPLALELQLEEAPQRA